MAGYVIEFVELNGSVKLSYFRNNSGGIGIYHEIFESTPKQDAIFAAFRWILEDIREGEHDILISWKQREG